MPQSSLQPLCALCKRFVNVAAMPVQSSSGTKAPSHRNSMLTAQSLNPICVLANFLHQSANLWILLELTKCCTTYLSWQCVALIELELTKSSIIDNASPANSWNEIEQAPSETWCVCLRMLVEYWYQLVSTSSTWASPSALLKAVIIPKLWDNIPRLPLVHTSFQPHCSQPSFIWEFLLKCFHWPDTLKPPILKFWDKIGQVWLVFADKDAKPIHQS